MLLSCGVGEDSWEFPGHSKEIKPVNLKGNQPWILIGRTDVETEVPILWPPDAKIWLMGKNPDAGENWGQENKGVTEDEMTRWYHWLNGHELEQTQGDGDGQGSRPGGLQSTGSQKVGHDWVTKQGQSDLWSDFESDKILHMEYTWNKSMSLWLHACGRYISLHVTHACFLCQLHSEEFAPVTLLELIELHEPCFLFHFVFKIFQHNRFSCFTDKKTFPLTRQYD